MLPLVEKKCPYACTVYAEYLYDIKDYESAEKYSIFAIENGDNISVCLLGQIYIITKQYDKISEYERLIKLATDRENTNIHMMYNNEISETPYFILAKLYTYSGNAEKGTQILLNLQLPEHKKFLIYLELVMITIYAQSPQLLEHLYEYLNLFEEHGGFQKIKEIRYMKYNFDGLRLSLIGIKLQRFIETSDINKFLECIFKCSPNEQVMLLKKLKIVYGSNRDNISMP